MCAQEQRKKRRKLLMEKESRHRIYYEDADKECNAAKLRVSALLVLLSCLLHLCASSFGQLFALLETGKHVMEQGKVKANMTHEQF